MMNKFSFPAISVNELFFLLRAPSRANNIYFCALA